MVTKVFVQNNLKVCLVSEPKIQREYEIEENNIKIKEINYCVSYVKFDTALNEEG